MRVREFRAKDATGQWNFGYVVKDFEDNYYITSLNGQDTYYAIKETIGQFTGVQDNKGTDVYEGDKFNISGTIYYVQYIEDQCRYVCTTGFGYDTRNCFDLTCDSIFYETVIGNIHE